MDRQTKHNELLNETMDCYTLASGVKCYVVRKPGYVEKEAAVAFNYGSADIRYRVNGEWRETPAGIAHFLEHKLFEDETRSVFDEFTKMGASVNAFTNFTNTAYYFNCTERFEDNLKLLLSFVQTPYFTDENVEKEKGIIEQEINMYRDNFFWRAYLNAQQAMYRQSPVRLDIAGTAESIGGIRKDLLYECYHSFYTPDNMVVICVGDFDPDEIAGMVSPLVTAKERKEIRRDYGEEPDAVAQPQIEDRMPLSRPMFCLGFKDNDRQTGLADKIAGVKTALDCLFGQSSRFYEESFTQGLIDTSFSSEYTCGVFFGAAMFSGACTDPFALRDRVRQELARAGQSGIDPSRFETIKRKHIGRFIRSFNQVDGIVTGQIDLFSKILDLFDIMDAYQRLTLDSVSALAAGLLREENMALSVVWPEEA